MNNNMMLDTLRIAEESMEGLKAHYCFEQKEVGYKCLRSGVVVFEMERFECDCLACNAEASMRACLRELKVLRAAIVAELA